MPRILVKTYDIQVVKRRKDNLYKAQKFLEHFPNWVKYTYEEYKANRGEEKVKQNEKRKEKLKTELEKLEKTE